MEFIFLGTSSGMPTKQRNVTGLAISPNNTKRWYLVDCGEATQHQLLHAPLSLMNLAAVMITHIHGDHCYGLPGLLASAATQGRTEPLTLIGPAPLKRYLDAVCQHTTLMLPYPIEFHAVETLNSSLALPHFAVSRIPMSHRVPSYAYHFRETNRTGKLNTEKLKREGIPPGPLWGRVQQGEDVTLDNGRRLAAAEYRLPDKPRQIIVGGDNDRPELLADHTHQLDLLIHEATYTQDVADQVEPGPQHSSVRNVARFAQAGKIPNLILTHFSQRYHNQGGLGMARLHDEAAQHFSGNLHLASDFDVYQLDMQRRVTLVRNLQQASRVAPTPAG